MAAYLKYRESHIEVWKKKGRDYYLKHKKEAKLRSKQRYWENRVEELKQARKKHLRKKYGITPEQYDVMFKQQNGVCAICGKPERVRKNTGVINRLSVDHDHKTGKVRGLLCHSCNVRVGVLDNVKFIEKAKIYLKGK